LAAPQALKLAQPPAEQIVGSYALVRRLGAGAMG
jgi:hypothetical protein